MPLNKEQIDAVVEELNKHQASRSESNESICVFSKEQITNFCKDKNNRERVFDFIVQMQDDDTIIGKIPNIKEYLYEVFLPTMEDVLKDEAIKLANMRDNATSDDIVKDARWTARLLAGIGANKEAGALRTAYKLPGTNIPRAVSENQVPGGASANVSIISSQAPVIEKVPYVEEVKRGGKLPSPRENRRKVRLDTIAVSNEESRKKIEEDLKVKKELEKKKQSLERQLKEVNREKSQNETEIWQERYNLLVNICIELQVLAEKMMDTFAKGSAKRIANSAADLKVTIMKVRDNTIKLFSRGFEDISDNTIKAFGDLQRTAYGAFKVFSQVVYDAKEKFLDTATSRVTDKRTENLMKDRQISFLINDHKENIEKFKAELLNEKDEGKKKAIEEKITGVQLQISTLEVEQRNLIFAETQAKDKLLAERLAGLDVRSASQLDANIEHNFKTIKKTMARVTQDEEDAQRYAQIRKETFDSVKQTLRNYGAKVGGSNRGTPNNINSDEKIIKL